MKITEVQVPTTIHEALNQSNWRKVVFDEMSALEKTGTWEIFDIQKYKNTVGCKWIFTVKHRAEKSVERLKARLIAKGFTQAYRVDNQETFAPVVKLNTVRVLLSLVANIDWSLNQLDVKNAFLNGDLEEEAYMEIPPSFEGNNDFNKVSKL